MRLVSIERSGDTYVTRHETGIAWTIDLRLDTSRTPFREEVIWPAAAVVVIAGGPDVHFVSSESGTILKTLSLDDDLFGHFGPTDGNVLHILGWRNVIAVGKPLVVCWVSRDVAVDGITWRGQDKNRIQLSAEMDPPGGWVDVELDAITGREISREGPR